MKQLAIAILSLLAVSTTASAIDRLEISASYGALPATGILKEMSEISFDNVPVQSFKDAKDMGSINASLNFRLTKGIGIGLVYAYSSQKQDIECMEDLVSATKYMAEQEYTYHSIMPQLKFNWFNTKLLTFYSRFAGGVTFIRVKGEDLDLGDKLTNLEETKKYVAFQVSPIGLEVGNNLAVFVEGGFGTMGVLQGGIRLRL